VCFCEPKRSCINKHTTKILLGCDTKDSKISRYDENRVSVTSHAKVKVRYDKYHFFSYTCDVKQKNLGNAIDYAYVEKSSTSYTFSDLEENI